MVLCQYFAHPAILDELKISKNSDPRVTLCERIMNFTLFLRPAVRACGCARALNCKLSQVGSSRNALPWQSSQLSTWKLTFLCCSRIDRFFVPYLSATMWAKAFAPGIEKKQGSRWGKQGKQKSTLGAHNFGGLPRTGDRERGNNWRREGRGTSKIYWYGGRLVDSLKSGKWQHDHTTHGWQRMVFYGNATQRFHRSIALPLFGCAAYMIDIKKDTEVTLLGHRMNSSYY